MSTPAVPFLEGARTFSRLPAWASLGRARRLPPAAPGGAAAPADGPAVREPALPVPAHLSAVEITILLLLGAGAALSTAFLKAPWRIPGSSILWSVFPIALAVALVPRRWAGSMAAAGALATMAALAATTSASPGPGALTSLLVTGPLLDLMLAGARTGWRLYAGFMLAGLGANLCAFAVRAGTASLGWARGFDGPRRGGGLGRGGGMGGGLGGGHGLGGGGGGGRGLGSALADTGSLWVRHALLTYAVAGLLAGLISAAAWFRFRRPARP